MKSIPRAPIKSEPSTFISDTPRHFWKDHRRLVIKSLFPLFSSFPHHLHTTTSPPKQKKWKILENPAAAGAKVNCWIHGCSTSRNSLSNSSALSGSSINLHSLLPLFTLCVFFFCYFRFWVGAKLIFWFLVVAVGPCSLSLFKRPVLLPCDHLFCRFVTSSLRCIVSVADFIAWIYWCNFSLKKFGIICFFSSSSFLLLAVPAWRIVQRLVMNVLYVTRSMLKQVTYYQDSFMLLLAIGRVLGDSADFLFYFVFLYLI